MKSKKTALILKILSLLLFICIFFPFFNITCGYETKTISGYNTFRGGEIFSTSYKGSPLCIIFILLPLVIFLMMYLKKKMTAFIFTVILGAADFLGLIILKNKIYGIVQEKGEGFIEINTEYGYNLSLIISTVVVVFALYGIYRLKEKKNKLQHQELVRYCINCGCPLLKDDHFCIKCGFPVGEKNNHKVIHQDISPQEFKEEKNIDSNKTQLLIQTNSDDPTFLMADRKLVTLLIKCNGKQTRGKIINFPCIVGRSADAAAICIMDISISRKHLSFDLINNEVVVQDLNSSNGVLINGNKIEPGEAKAVFVNDVITAGRAEIVIDDITN